MNPRLRQLSQQRVYHARGHPSDRCRYLQNHIHQSRENQDQTLRPMLDCHSLCPYQCPPPEFLRL